MTAACNALTAVDVDVAAATPFAATETAAAAAAAAEDDCCTRRSEQCLLVGRVHVRAAAGNASAETVCGSHIPPAAAAIAAAAAVCILLGLCVSKALAQMFRPVQVAACTCNALAAVAAAAPAATVAAATAAAAAAASAAAPAAAAAAVVVAVHDTTCQGKSARCDGTGSMTY